jgi:hypothetical protein
MRADQPGALKTANVSQRRVGVSAIPDLLLVVFGIRGFSLRRAQRHNT